MTPTGDWRLCAGRAAAPHCAAAWACARTIAQWGCGRICSRLCPAASSRCAPCPSPMLGFSSPHRPRATCPLPRRSVAARAISRGRARHIRLPHRARGGRAGPWSRVVGGTCVVPRWDERAAQRSARAHAPIRRTEQHGCGLLPNSLLRWGVVTNCGVSRAAALCVPAPRGGVRVPHITADPLDRCTAARVFAPRQRAKLTPRVVRTRRARVL